MKNLLLASLFFLSSLFASNSFAKDISNWDPQMLMQVVGEKNSTERTISWQTTNNIPTYLELIDKNNKITKFAPHSSIITYNTLKNNTHTVNLKNLQTDASYQYRIHGSDYLVSPTYTFKTSKDSKDISALIFGDAQSYDYNVFKKTTQIALKIMPQADLFLSVGDQVDNGERTSEWQGWYKGASSIVPFIPIAPAVGNHETYGANRNTIDPKPYLSFFSTPNNGPENLKRHAYTFTQGIVRFFILDTQIGEERAVHPHLLQAQTLWLDRELKKSTEDWNLVIMHRPPFETNGTLNNIGNAFMPIFTKYKVPLVFTGHTHIYERTIPINGTTYITTGRSGTKTYPNSPASKKNTKYSAFYYNPLKEPNFLTLKIRQDQATICAYSQSGTLIDKFKISKNKNLM